MKKGRLKPWTLSTVMPWPSKLAICSAGTASQTMVVPSVMAVTRGSLSTRTVNSTGLLAGLGPL